MSGLLSACVDTPIQWARLTRRVLASKNCSKLHLTGTGGWTPECIKAAALCFGTIANGAQVVTEMHLTLLFECPALVEEDSVVSALALLKNLKTLNIEFVHCPEEEDAEEESIKFTVPAAIANLSKLEALSISIELDDFIAFSTMADLSAEDDDFHALASLRAFNVTGFSSVLAPWISSMPEVAVNIMGPNGEEADFVEL